MLSYNVLCCSVEHSQSTGKEEAGKPQPALPDLSLMESRAVGPCKSWHLAVGSRSQVSLTRDWLNAIVLCPHHVPHTQQTVRVVLHKTSPGSCWPWAAPANSHFSYNVLFPSFGSTCIRLLMGSILQVPMAPHCPAHIDSVEYGRVESQVISQELVVFSLKESFLPILQSGEGNPVAAYP